MRVSDSYYLFSSFESDSIVNIEDRIYGYIYSNGTFYSNCSLKQDFSYSCDDIGAYCIIQKQNDGFQIITDNLGLGLLFYYKEGNNWAVSNSFYKLFDFLSKRVNLTIDEKYHSLYFENDVMASPSVVHTPVYEIKLLPIFQYITIKKGKLKVENKQTFHKMISLCSKEGLDYIDNWATKWIDFIHCLLGKYDVNLQLSGGFDSRITYSLFNVAKINYDQINIESSLTMKEDLEIANKISNLYGFTLNSGKYNTFKKERISDGVATDLNIFSRFGIHKEYLPGPNYYYFDSPIFIFTGNCSIRDYFRGNIDEYVKFAGMHRYGKSSPHYSKYIKESIIESAKEFESSMGINIKDSINIMNYLLPFGRSRFNYGTATYASSLMNQFQLAPIAELMNVMIENKENEDYNLLYAYIICRFAPELLDVPFCKNETFSKTTIKLAKKMNADRNPFVYHNNKKSKLKVINGSHPLNSNHNYKLNDMIKEYLTKKNNYDLGCIIYSTQTVTQSIDALSSNIRHNEKKPYHIYTDLMIIDKTRSSPVK